MRASFLIPSLLLYAAPAQAEDFPWFKDRQYEGWVEDSGTGEARVKIVPFILGPDTSMVIPAGMGFNFGGETPVAASQPEITPDGRLKLSYKIVREGGLPNYVLGAVANQTGIAPARLNMATKSFLKATYRSVTLEIGGVPYETKDLGGGLLTGDVSGAFYIPTDRYDLMRTLRSGDFRLILDYSYPVAEYSSLKVDLSGTAISNAWVKAFRQVVRSKSTSGGKFLFFDFSSEVSRVQVQERVQAGGSSRISTSVNVEFRDPTPEQLARLEAVLGFAKQTYADMIARHQAGFQAAMTAANPALADAHDKYLKDLNASTPDTSQQLIAALSNLKDADALKFMAAGFQMRSGDASSYYRYDGSYAASQSSEVRTQYSEYLIRNGVIGAKNQSYTDSPQLVGAALDRAFDAMHMGMFYTASSQPLTAEQWAQGLLKAIDDRDLVRVKYAFDPRITDVGGRIDPNIAIDANQNRLIHRAVRTRDTAIVKLLLDNGASPQRKNRYGDTALDLANDNRDAAMRSLLQPYMAKKGKALIALDHPGIKITAINVMAPQGAGQIATTLGAESSRIAIDDYPMLMQSTAILVGQLWVGPNDYPNIRFNHRVLGTSGYQRLIEVPIVLDRSYRIRDGQTIDYREAVRFAGWDKGFVVQPQ